MNLVWFCQKVNIPYEVYFFTSEVGGSTWSQTQKSIGEEVFTYKYGNVVMEKCHLVCIAKNGMKKTKLDESLMYIWSMALSYHGRFNHSGVVPGYKGDNFGCPTEFYLGSTPLNQALIALNQMIPIFKSKNNIEKMSVITLTDGGANWCFGNTMTDDGKTYNGHGSTPIIKVGKKAYSNKEKPNYRSDEYTSLLLDILRKQHNVKTIGFFVTKKIRAWDMDEYVNNYRDYNHKEKLRKIIQSNISKNKFCASKQTRI